MNVFHSFNLIPCDLCHFSVHTDMTATSQNHPSSLSPLKLASLPLGSGASLRPVFYARPLPTPLFLRSTNNRNFQISIHTKGVASNEAEEAVASSLFCARTRARIGDISYKTSACMREVNCITVKDLIRTINRDLMVGKRPAALITTFFTKRGRKCNLYFVDILYFYVFS